MEHRDALLNHLVAKDMGFGSQQSSTFKQNTVTYSNAAWDLEAKALYNSTIITNILQRILTRYKQLCFGVK